MAIWDRHSVRDPGEQENFCQNKDLEADFASALYPVSYNLPNADQFNS